MIDNKATKWLILAIGCSILSSAAIASEIYRWTDENGTVHYGDRPTGEADEQRVAITSRPTDNASVQNRYNDRFGNSDENRARDDGEDEESSPTRAERRAAAAKRQAECQANRAQLERYEAARRMYREDENGERQYMTNPEIEEARQRVRELVRETCD